MNNKMTTHGMPSWSELMTSDPQAATKFYGELFGWQFETMAMPDGDYHVAALGEETIAGIMAIPEEAKGSPSFWGQYFTVNDVDSFAVNITALGGSIIVPPTEVPGVGRFVMFQDPQGATLSAFQYSDA
jgi:predicted enzyme related to lactoylglutathione lyase